MWLSLLFLHGQLAAVLVSRALDYLWNLLRRQWSVYLICIITDLWYQTNKSLS